MVTTVVSSSKYIMKLSFSAIFLFLLSASCSLATTNFDKSNGILSNVFALAFKAPTKYISATIIISITIKAGTMNLAFKNLIIFGTSKDLFVLFLYTRYKENRTSFGTIHTLIELQRQLLLPQLMLESKKTAFFPNQIREWLSFL